jgi:diguanylate cyclase (GGDEF)-like protein
MSSLKNIWIISIILFIALFLFLVYPRVDVIIYNPTFEIATRILLFLAFTSFTAFTILELRKISRSYSKSVLEKEEKPKTESEVDLHRLDFHLDVDPDEIYQEIANQIVKTVQSSLMAQTVFLYLFDEPSNCYTLQASKSLVEDIELSKKFKIEGSLFGSYHLSPEPLIFSGDQIDNEKLIYYKEPFKVGSLMIIPVEISEGTFIGILGLDSIGKNEWGEEDIDLAISFAKIFSSGVWQVDAIDKQKLYAQFLQELCELNTEISLGTNQIEIYKKVSTTLRKIFNFNKLTIAMTRGGNEQDLAIEYVDGYELDYGIGHQIEVNDGIWKEIIQDGKKLKLDNYADGVIPYRFQSGDLDTFPFKSCLGVPLKVGNRLLGGLLLESFASDSYSYKELDTLELIGKNVSSIINRVYIYQSMKNLAMIDGLTNIYNHRAFEQQLKVEIERCRRFGTEVTLLILDIDKFKRINDTYGHLFGDFVLKETANIIKGSIRTVDIVARYGGEEFAAILVNAYKSVCINTAERIRKNIQDFTFSKNDIVEKVTISIGMSEYPSDGKNIQNIIAAADMAMYQSKRDGGNKVTIYKPELES